MKSKLVCALIAFAAATSATPSSFLSESLVRNNQLQDVLEHIPATEEPLCQDSTTGPIETTLCHYETIESINPELFANLKDLVKTPFFKYFQADLYRECPFWQENSFCMNKECGITTVDESEIPEKWRAASLSKIELPPPDERIQLPGCYYRDSDYCFLDDMSEGEYVDLSMIPERYTGYSGPSANRVWKSIYEENCFGVAENFQSSGSVGEAEMNMMSSSSLSPISLPDTLTDVFRSDGSPPDEDGECLEKRVYYKIISGLHASISTHICLDYLDQRTGEMAPNLSCFVSRIASHPERLQYIYFNTVLMLRAVARIAPYLSAYDYCSDILTVVDGKPVSHSDAEEEAHMLSKLSNVISIAEHVGKFDESVLFRGENANILKEEFKVHFRNVTRIMDCVGCDKCRLWGKVQTMGVATALKVLFEMDEKALDPRKNTNLLQRSEVVALFNTLHRFSESLQAVDTFREMWRDVKARDVVKNGTNEQEKLFSEVQKAVQGTPRMQPPPAPIISPAPEPVPEEQTQLLGSLLDIPALQQLYTRGQALLTMCKHHAVMCWSLLTEAWTDLVDAVSPLRTEL